jgi:tetratricopeptide (TPR) repeat protein
MLEETLARMTRVFGAEHRMTRATARSLSLCRGAGECVLCLDRDPPPIQSGCACRGEAGLAHPACRVDAAVAQREHRGPIVWGECLTCRQPFTGAMKRHLSRAFRERARTVAERAMSLTSIGYCLVQDGRWREARVELERALEEFDASAAQPRSHGFDAEEQYFQYLASAESAFAEVLGALGEREEAVSRLRAALQRSRAAVGPEADATLGLVTNLGTLLLTVARPRRPLEAEDLARQQLVVYGTMTPRDRRGELVAQNLLAMALLSQRSQCNSKAAQAAALLRTLDADFERVFGPTHPYSLQATSNLGDALFEVGDLAGAERAYRAAVHRARELGRPDAAEHEAQLAKAERAQGKGPCARTGCEAVGARACARCRAEWYCGAECQRAHWRAHKPTCAP